MAPNVKNFLIRYKPLNLAIGSRSKYIYEMYQVKFVFLYESKRDYIFSAFKSHMNDKG